MILRAFLGMFISYAISEHLMSNAAIGDRGESLSYFIDIFLHGVIQPASVPTDPRSYGAEQRAPDQGTP